MSAAVGDPVSAPTVVAVVCTANRCRSPLAAAILAHDLERAERVRTEAGIAVVSFGTEATAAPATPGTVTAARRIGLDLSTHVATRIDPAVLAQASLVVTMERRHVQDVAIAVPAAFPRTYTLKELVRRGSAIGARGSDEPLDAWIARAGADRRPVDVLGRSPIDDVADPTVDRLVDHDALAAELSELSARLVALAWPPSG